MAIAKMKLVNIISDKDRLDEVLLRLMEADDFHPEPASKIAQSVHGLKTLQDSNPFADIVAHFQDIENDMHMDLELTDFKTREYDLQKIRDYIDEKHAEFMEIETVRQELETVIQENKDALIQLQNIKSIDVSLDDIFSCRYLTVRFGRLPLDSVDKLVYYKSRPFLFTSFRTDQTYSWCVYFTTPSYQGEVDNIFSSLYFERIMIPDFVHGTPERAEEMIQDEIDADYRQLAYVEEMLAQLKESCMDNFLKIKAELHFLNQTFEARKYVVDLGERCSVTGFIMADDEEAMKRLYADLEGVEIEIRPSHSDRRLSPPTKLKNGWFARPFSMFVEMYGLPSYEGIDPTMFVALTYTLLFGIMFGDVGQGIALCIVGYIAYKWKGMRLGEIGIRIGLSSALFGFVYGSVFGNETMLDPFYHAVFGMEEKPFEIMSSDFIMPMLMTAIAGGAVLIVLCMLLHVYILAKQKDWGEFLFSHNGIAGLIFYVALLGGAGAQLGFGIAVFSKPYVILLIVLPLVLIFLKEPIVARMEGKPMFPDGVGGFFMQSFFELFEICLSFMTNTISYLRVGGFILSHAGMMLVVTLLTEMSGGAGILVAILGNIFVMCLEGMIVGIQILRLEFYEMFSRFYSSDGIAFVNLKNK